MENFVEIAKGKWPNRTVEGAGRWAVVPLDSPTIYLHGTPDEARAQVLDPRRVRIVDPIEPVRKPNCPRLYRNPADQEPD